MHNPIFRLLAMLLLYAITTNSWANIVYDASSSFEQGYTTQSNPNGVWSYGYSSSFVGPITRYDQTELGPLNGPYAQYWLSSSVNIGESPAMEFNNGPAYNDGNISFGAYQLVLVSGIGGQYSDLIFTAPASGKYSIASSFMGDQYGIGTFVGVVENGSVLFNSSVNNFGQTVPFDSTVNLTAGSKLVFSVGPDGGLQNTGLSATITELNNPIPEPATLALVGLGFTGMTYARRCKSATDMKTEKGVSAARQGRVFQRVGIPLQ